MPEVTIEIGGRRFEVACQAGAGHAVRVPDSDGPA